MPTSTSSPPPPSSTDTLDLAAKPGDAVGVDGPGNATNPDEPDTSPADTHLPQHSFRSPRINGPIGGTVPSSHMRPAPPPGIYIQAWVARMRDPESGLSALAEQCAHSGFQGIVIHGFPRGLPRTWKRLSSRVIEQGLLALAAFGLDGTRDDDGGALTPTEKGACVAQVAADSGCAGVYLDAEGRWDRGAERHALELGAALRDGAPDAWVADQPWFAIDSHGELARTALPDDGGGVFRGFPVDEFAFAAVNGDRARQAYWANFFRRWGDDAYERVFAWMERDWAKIRPALAARNLARTEAVTIQGYGHRKHVDVADCAIDWAYNRQTRLVVWCEPVPEKIALEALAAAAAIHRLGFAGAGVPPGRAVRDAQSALGITTDGVVGPETLRALHVR